jgi:hypothetical protein
MKKLLLLTVMVVFTLGVFGQAGIEKNLLSEYSLTTDTVTNTGTVYMNVRSTFSSNNNLVISAKVTNVSGTTAGTAILEWSINGTDYATHPTADTLTLTDGAVHLWELTTTGAKKYRINFTGTGTHVSIVEGQYVYKAPQYVYRQ